MAAPLYSTITLCTEIVMSFVITYIFYSGYKRNKFPYALAGIALVYEIAFNISYMVYRLLTHDAAAAKDTPLEIALAVFHGTLSLIMFVALVVFFVLAWRGYKKGTNYFKKHKIMSLVTLVLWLLAVVSGIVFYSIEYIL